MDTVQQLKKWTGIALLNLFIVAVLGVILRSKLLFPIPIVNYKFFLHAHSHFAFGGWVTLSLLVLMIRQLLPAAIANRRVYAWLLSGVFLTSLGMLLTFPFQGYGFAAILFSMLFIGCTYAAAYVFIKDIRRSGVSSQERQLVTGAMIFLVLSSLGPFTLAVLMATGTSGPVLYNDAIYSYLHLQYNGFFTPVIFALLFNRYRIDSMYSRMFTRLLLIAVLPSTCMAWLWHAPGIFIHIIAATGSVLLVVALIFFLRIRFTGLSMLTKAALGCFILKQIMQAGSVIPYMGNLVFFNRPVIIGYLHLVLLGFISLYLLAHFIHAGLMDARSGVIIFAAGVFINEIALFVQGLGAMLMWHSDVFQWILWVASICLMTGALLMSARFYQRSFFLKMRMDKSKGITAQHSMQATE